MNEAVSPDRWTRRMHVKWAVALLLPAAFGVVMARHAVLQWDPSVTGRTPAFPSAQDLTAQLGRASTVANAFAALACIHLTFAAARTCWKPACCRRFQPLTFLAAMPIAGAPALTLVLLPFEDPYTLSGSPLASLFSVFILTALGALFALPGLILLIRWWFGFEE